MFTNTICIPPTKDDRKESGSVRLLTHNVHFKGGLLGHPNSASLYPAHFIPQDSWFQEIYAYEMSIHQFKYSSRRPSLHLHKLRHCTRTHAALTKQFQESKRIQKTWFTQPLTVITDYSLFSGCIIYVFTAPFCLGRSVCWISCSAIRSIFTAAAQCTGFFTILQFADLRKVHQFVMKDTLNVKQMLSS